jgi:hypothetical protein
VKKILFWIGFVLAAAVASVPLALLAEGCSLQYGARVRTPGMIVAVHYIPSNLQGFEALAKGMDIQLSVDVAFRFLVICILGITVSLWRHHRARPLHATKS